MMRFASLAGFLLCLAGAGMGLVAYYFPAYREWVWLGSAAALLAVGICLIALARRARGDDKADWSEVADAGSDLLD